MAEIKLTKNELRAQQNRLLQLQKYLPTLQLKKAMLQLEVIESRNEISRLEEDYSSLHQKVEGYSSLLSDTSAVDPSDAAKITNITKRYENIAGVEVPYFEGVTFADFHYNLFATPAWVDPVIVGIRSLAEARVKIMIAREKAGS